MPRRRVVITGLGLISAIGNNKQDFWNNLIKGCSGIDKITRFDASSFATQIAAEVKQFDPQDYISRTEARRMDRFVQFACAAARIAVEDARLSINQDENHRVGVWVGSGIGGLETFEKQHASMLKKGVAGINPFFVPMYIANMAAGQVSIMLGAKGPSGCTVTACASGTSSIGEAFHIIQNGKADIMIAGGTEASITPMGIGGFCAMKAMSTRNDEPQKACRPFDLNRDGFVMGEGAGILILEDMDHAVKRGADIYAELAGYGASSDAYHMVQPDLPGEGASLAFKMALTDAGITPNEVDYINTHGTGTPLNDAMETNAIKKAFGEHSYKMLVSSTKPATGHMLGAAGAVELIAATLAICNDTVPPTLNLDTSDPDCDLDYVSGQARKRVINVAISDSLGFGGHNGALVVRKFAG